MLPVQDAIEIICHKYKLNISKMYLLDNKDYYRTFYSEQTKKVYKQTISYSGYNYFTIQ